MFFLTIWSVINSRSYFSKILQEFTRVIELTQKPPDPGEFLQNFRKIRTGIYDAPDGQKEAQMRAICLRRTL
jgi:hypothetical protein